MSKSLKRVRNALEAAGIVTEIREMAQETRTANDAARAIGCQVDQIAKSVIFRGLVSGDIYLFLTAGTNQVATDKASALAGEALGRADAALIRSRTGFAIGGVSPVGHLTPPRAYVDPRLLEFREIWAAAGTPRHVFCVESARLPNLSGAQVAEFTA